MIGVFIVARIELFHGSEKIIEKPEYSLGKAYNDYGRGFYCTLDYELAAEWACRHASDGYINKYSLNIENLRLLDLSDGNHSVLEWIAILLKNRNFRLNGELAEEVRDYIIRYFSTNLTKYDIVRGYRADDSYFQYAEAFIENALSINGLARAMELGNLGIQWALVSKKAFKEIEFIEAIPVFKEDYYPKYVERDTEARKKYRDSIKGRTRVNEVFAMDIIREEMTKDDARIQRIVRK